jgi:hypothetical protein
LKSKSSFSLIIRYSADTSLWKVLKTVELLADLNITTREDTPAVGSNRILKKIASMGKQQKLYEIPCCLGKITLFLLSVNNKEFSTIESLSNTSLAQAGVNSGNAVIRVLFKFAEKSLQEYLPDIKAANESTGIERSERASASVVMPARESSLAVDEEISKELPSEPSSPHVDAESLDAPSVPIKKEEAPVSFATQEDVRSISHI